MCSSDLAKQFLDLWNPFSDFLKKNMTPDGNLSVRRNSKTVIKALSSSKNKLKTVKDLNQIIDALGDAGVLLDIVHANGKYSFRFKNERIKNCLWEGGSILELHTYHHEMSNSDDCQVWVHLDWDGIVNSKSGDDVTNEIDVLSLRGYVPTFISCKSGNLDQHQILHALYELDTVTRRFGGRYAKKVLVTVEDIGDVHLKRALEMGIEVMVASEGFL